MTRILSTLHCVYCGLLQPLVGDHFIPISKQREGEHNFEVPCCAPCNGIAGSRRFASFEDKWAFVQNRRIQTNRSINLQTSLELLNAVLFEIPNHIENDNAKTAQRRKPNTNRISYQQALDNFFLSKKAS